jgi:hypothetical protein
VEILERLKGPMDSPALKVSLIVSISLIIAIKLFYALMIYSQELMDWYFANGIYLGYLNRILVIYLSVAFAIYAFRKSYKAVYYGLLIIYALSILQYLSYVFTGPRSLDSFVINLVAVSGLTQALTILLSQARSNKYLMIYAILTLMTTLASGNLVNAELISLLNIIQLASAFIPVCFIYLIMEEFKVSRPDNKQDILDT